MRLFALFAAVLIIGAVISELLIAKFNGKAVPVPKIPRDSHLADKGAPLHYVVMGDSTAAGQGSNYQHGIAMATASYLAETHEVTLTNLAVSGATAHDVLANQLGQVPSNVDVVLLSVGANDTLHLRSAAKVRSDLASVVEGLTKQNCHVKIVLTGAPAMGSIARFPQPLRAVAGWRGRVLNEKAFLPVARSRQLTFAPIAKDTGDAFAKNPSLFAQDKFHPNERGYAVWAPVLNKALSEALATQPSHCTP